MTKYLELLKQGVKDWNQWWKKDVPSGVDLLREELYRSQLRVGSKPIEARLSGADLREFDLREFDLSGVNLSGTNLSGADLSGINLSGADLCGANLRDSNLSGVNLSGTNLSGADLCGANLSDSNLSGVQVLRTNFTSAIFTGACLQDWNTNSATNFQGVICEYVYFAHGLVDSQFAFIERRPRNGSFQPGEFAVLFQQVVDTVDLFFEEGINWQAFFQSFQSLRQEYANDALTIQAIEKKRGDSFVVRLEVSSEADKFAIERSAKESYKIQLALVEQRYRAELNAKDREIVAYREQSANLMKITEMLAARPPMAEVKHYDLREANFSGGFAEIVQGDQVGGTQYNNDAPEKQSLAEAAAEIQALLKQLEQTAPAESTAEKMTLAANAIAQIESNPTLKQRAVAALSSGGLKAFEAAIDHPVAAFVVGAIEGWKDAE